MGIKGNVRDCTMIKKKRKFFLIYKETQMGAAAKSYMRKGKKGERVRKDKKSKKGWECTNERRTSTKDRGARRVGSTQREDE